MSGVPPEQKTGVPPRLFKASREMLGDPGVVKGPTRRAGVLLLVCGVLLLSLAAGDVLAGAVPGGDRGDGVRGSGAGETINGTGGSDLLYGLSGGDGIFGGKGADEIYGGLGPDVMLGGPGNDFIEAKDGVGDFVGCGSGHDVVSIDEKDHVSADCEIVYRA